MIKLNSKVHRVLVTLSVAVTVMGMAATAVPGSSVHAAGALGKGSEMQDKTEVFEPVSDESAEIKGEPGEGGGGDAQGQWYWLNNWYGSSRVIIDSYNPGYTSRTYAGRVYIAPSGAYPVYIQAKGAATMALDGDWFRLTNNYTGAGTVYWSKTFSLSYNYMKFRMCRSIPNQTDSCSSPISVFP